MVLKNRLDCFPPVGRTFRISDGGAARPATVEAIPCTCRGPDKPHEHYRIRWPGLVKGTTVTLAPAPGGPGVYSLAVRR